MRSEYLGDHDKAELSRRRQGSGCYYGVFLSSDLLSPPTLFHPIPPQKSPVIKLFPYELGSLVPDLDSTSTFLGVEPWKKKKAKEKERKNKSPPRVVCAWIIEGTLKNPALHGLPARKPRPGLIPSKCVTEAQEKDQLPELIIASFFARIPSFLLPCTSRWWARSWGNLTGWRQRTTPTPLIRRGRGRRGAYWFFRWRHLSCRQFCLPSNTCPET